MREKDNTSPHLNAASLPASTGRPSVVAHTEGPWEYIPSNEHHGPYVVASIGGDVCDCYAMSNPSALSVRNGGDSRPLHFQHESADANARLIAAAPDLLEALKDIVDCAEDGTRFHYFVERSAVGAARAAIRKAEGTAAIEAKGAAPARELNPVEK